MENSPEKVSADEASIKVGDTNTENTYQQEAKFAFCPLKDLNLPASYDEVLERFKRLQGERAVESLN